MRREIARWFLRPLRFGFVGLLNTVLGLGVIFAGKAFLGLGDFPANLLGYGTGLLASFVLNRWWTFRHHGSFLPAFGRFGLAFGVAYAANLAAVFGLRDGIQLNAYAAQALGVIPYTICFYLANAYYVFPQNTVARSASATDLRKN